MKIQNGLKSYRQLKSLDQVVGNVFFDELMGEVSHENVWRKEGQEGLVKEFVGRYGGSGEGDGMGRIVEKKVEELEGWVDGVGGSWRGREYLFEEIVLVLTLALKSPPTKQSIVEKIYSLIKTATEGTK